MLKKPLIGTELRKTLTDLHSLSVNLKLINGNDSLVYSLLLISGAAVISAASPIQISTIETQLCRHFLPRSEHGHTVAADRDLESDAGVVLKIPHNIQQSDWQPRFLLLFAKRELTSREALQVCSKTNSDKASQGTAKRRTHYKKQLRKVSASFIHFLFVRHKAAKAPHGF